MGLLPCNAALALYCLLMLTIDLIKILYKESLCEYEKGCHNLTSQKILVWELDKFIGVLLVLRMGWKIGENG